MYSVGKQERYAFRNVKIDRLPLILHYQSRLGLFKSGTFHEYSLCALEKTSVDYFCHRLIFKSCCQKKNNKFTYHLSACIQNFINYSYQINRQSGWLNKGRIRFLCKGLKNITKFLSKLAFKITHNRQPFSPVTTDVG